MSKLSLDGYFGKSVISLIGMGISLFLAYLFHLVMVRMLPPSTYGDLSTLVALMVIVSMPIVSLQGLISREIAKNEKKGATEIASGIVRKYLKKTILSGIIVALLLSVAALAVFGFNSFGFAVVFVLFSIPFAYGSAIVNGYYQGKERMFHLAALIDIPMFLRLVLSVVFIYAGLELVGATLSFPLGFLLVLFPVAFYNGWFTGEGKEIKLNIKSSFLMILSTNILMLIFIYCDLFMVRLFLGAEAAGYYNTAEITAKIPYYLSNSLVFVLLPQASKLTFGDRGELLKRFLNSLLFIAPFAPAFIVLAEPMLSIFYGPIYSEMGSGAFRLLAVSMVVFGAANFLVNILWSQKKEILPLVLILTAIPVHLGILYTMLPSGGLEGAATATIISTSLFLFACMGGVVYYSIKQNVRT